ncbi:MAG: FAD-binding protein, partial [Bacteroidota bacterium]|nr:FAD-binding protein [Bacteroidota bacterium]
MSNQTHYPEPMAEDIYDVIIVGAGPAGLNAALILARCLRKIIVFDHGKPRNWKSDNIHGFLSRDGISPKELLKISK